MDYNFSMRNHPWMASFIGAAVVVGIVAFVALPKVPPTATGDSNLPSVRFTDVTASAGITFRHVSGATGRKLLPETMGAGVAVLDFDADDWPDLFFVNSCPWPGHPLPPGGPPTPALYRNNHDGTFSDVTRAAGLAVSFYGLGVAAGDFDNDGFADLFVSGLGGNKLFRNEGGQRFADVTDRAGVGGGSGLPATTPFEQVSDPIPFPASATWLDYDRDGRLDLFVGQYLTWSPARDLDVRAVLPNGVRAYVPPTQFPGAQCILYRNLGSGRFADVSAMAGIPVTAVSSFDGRAYPVGKALGVVACDPDADGWPDLVVACDTVRNFFFHNVADPSGGRRFTEMGELSGVAYADGRPRGGMGVDAAEVLPGFDAVVIANFSNEPNTLLKRVRSAPPMFADVALTTGLAGPTRAPMKFGAMFLDYDLDGRPDLFTANGHLEPDIAAAQPGQTFAQPPQLFWNTGRPEDLFVAVPATGSDLFTPQVGRGCAYLDFDHDGDPDIVTTENNGPVRLFRNGNATRNRWVRLVLVGTGSELTHDASGAEITITAGGVVRRFYETGSRGYLSQSERAITVGLGAAEVVEQLTVRWPTTDRHEQHWTRLKAGTTYRLVRGEATARPIPGDPHQD